MWNAILSDKMNAIIIVVMLGVFSLFYAIIVIRGINAELKELKTIEKYAEKELKRIDDEQKSEGDK